MWMDVNGGAQVMNHDLRCHSPASCTSPAVGILRVVLGTAPQAPRLGNATEDEEGAGHKHWVQSLSRQREGNDLFRNMLPISVAALVFSACTMQQEFDGTWYPHLETSLFLWQITNTFSNQHVKNMTALYAQILHMKAYIPKPSENTMVKIQHPNI